MRSTSILCCSLADSRSRCSPVTCMTLFRISESREDTVICHKNTHFHGCRRKREDAELTKSPPPAPPLPPPETHKPHHHIPCKLCQKVAAGATHSWSRMKKEGRSRLLKVHKALRNLNPQLPVLSYLQAAAISGNCCQLLPRVLEILGQF